MEEQLENVDIFQFFTQFRNQSQAVFKKMLENTVDNITRQIKVRSL